MGKKVLICGSRHYRDLDRVAEFVRSLPAELGLPLDSITIITGGAHGVDEAAENAARTIGIKVLTHPARWRLYGRAAGPIRNQAMVDECDMAYAFWDGYSMGTRDTINKMRAANKPVVVFLERHPAF